MAACRDVAAMAADRGSHTLDAIDGAVAIREALRLRETFKN